MDPTNASPDQNRRDAAPATAQEPLDAPHADKRTQQQAAVTRASNRLPTWLIFIVIAILVAIVLFLMRR